MVRHAKEYIQSDRRVEVSLNDDEFSALIRLCQADMRNMGFELRYLLIREFDRCGMIDEKVTWPCSLKRLIHLPSCPGWGWAVLRGMLRRSASSLIEQ